MYCEGCIDFGPGLRLVQVLTALQDAWIRRPLPRWQGPQVQALLQGMATIATKRPSNPLRIRDTFHTGARRAS